MLGVLAELGYSAEDVDVVEEEDGAAFSTAREHWGYIPPFFYIVSERCTSGDIKTLASLQWLMLPIFTPKNIHILFTCLWITVIDTHMRVSFIGHTSSLFEFYISFCCRNY